MKQRTCVMAIAAALVMVQGLPARAEKSLLVGPKLGLGFVTMTGEDASELPLTQGTDPGYLVRGHLGAFVTLVFNPHLAIDAEIAFVQRGAEWEKSVTSNDTTSTVTQSVGLDYIEIPILLKLNLPTTGKFEPYLLAGPSVAFNVGSETKVDLAAYKGDTKIAHFDAYADKIANASSTVFEAIVALGVEMKLGKNRLSIEGRYTRSFGDTFEDFPDLGAVPDDEAVITHIPSGKALDIQNSAFSVLIGFGFGFGL